MNVTCLNCGWVHFSVSKDYVNNWQEEWKKYWPTLDKEGREMFGLPDGPPGPEEEYYKCFFCRGSYKNFRDSKLNDCPDGCTIQPILDRNEVI